VASLNKNAKADGSGWKWGFRTSAGVWPPSGSRRERRQRGRDVGQNNRLWKADPVCGARCKLVQSGTPIVLTRCHRYWHPAPRVLPKSLGRARLGRSPLRFANPMRRTGPKCVRVGVFFGLDASTRCAKVRPGLASGQPASAIALANVWEAKQRCSAFPENDEKNNRSSFRQTWMGKTACCSL
jgi:hypothetical protein